MYTIDFFAEELELIKDISLRDLTRQALIQAPRWFWTAPASSTGRHHPPDNNVEGGLCHHTKKVVWLTAKLFQCFGLDTDPGISAAHVHDILKFGSGDEMDMTQYKAHGALAAVWLHKLEFVPGNWWFKHIDIALTEKWENVCRLVQTHMGQWSSCVKDVDEFIATTDLDAKLLHLADVAASHKAFVAIQFYDPSKAPNVEIEKEREYFKESGDGLVITFGKYDGILLKDLIATNPHYIKWLLKTDFPDEVKETVRLAEKEVLDDKLWNDVFGVGQESLPEDSIAQAAEGGEAVDMP